MNRELKRISALVLLMFAALFIASSTIQVFQVDVLRDNPNNSRTIEDSYEIQRGQILTSDGKVIASSKAVDDGYRYLRQYSNGKLYAAVTGFDPVSGQATGIEGALDKQLAGTSSTQFFDRLQNIITGQNPQGDSVQLTIDPKVQKAAYAALGNYTGAVVAIAPKTGAILAMVSKPSFDPNVLSQHDVQAVDAAYAKLAKAQVSPLINQAIAGDLNPPGSTFKLVVASAALESGKYTANSEFASPLSLTLPGTSTVITNSGGEACGTKKKASIATAVSLSCNIPMAELGEALGEQPIAAMAKSYGFGQPLSIPLTVTPSVYPTGLDTSQLMQTAFGQFNVRATPLQMAMVSAGIANGGTLMKPDLVAKVLSPSLDTVEQMSPTTFSSPISAATASAVKAMMVSSVASGAATNAKIDGVSVAGKTGTAQNGADDPYTLWFTGFAPADDPQVAVAVVIENGGGMGQTGYGNLLAAPVAKKVMEAVLNK